MYKSIEKHSCKCVLDGGSLETLCRCCSEQVFFFRTAALNTGGMYDEKKFLQRAKQGLNEMENTGAYFWTSPSYSTK